MIFVTIFIVSTTSSRNFPQQDDNLIIYEESTEDTDEKPIKLISNSWRNKLKDQSENSFVKYKNYLGQPISNRIRINSKDDLSRLNYNFNQPHHETRREEPEKDLDKYQYELDQPLFADFNALEIPSKQKKEELSETLCMNIPTKKKLLEQNGYDFKPNTLIEYSCQPLPHGGIHKPLLIPDNAQICKVVGSCQSRYREIRIFRKQNNLTRDAECWEKVSYDLNVGCQCLSHILQQPYA